MRKIGNFSHHLSKNVKEDFSHTREIRDDSYVIMTVPSAATTEGKAPGVARPRYTPPDRMQADAPPAGLLSPNSQGPDSPEYSPDMAQTVRAAVEPGSMAAAAIDKAADQTD